tara:strand:- start:4997 stop:5251 length:255 start_codon:yes stop_codon:yes gene_type:complete
VDIKSERHINNSKRLTRIDDNEIVVDYTFESNEALYDLCDLSGSILISGKLNNSTRIDVSTLAKGVYVFYIIDKGNVMKERIQI